MASSKRQLLVTIDDYDINFRRILGRGAFGIVYKGAHRTTKEPVAAKNVIYKEEGQEVNDYVVKMGTNELSIFRQLEGHPNIVQLLKHVDDEESHWLIMEFCDLGDLQAYMNGRKLNLPMKLKIMYECINAIAYMHSCKPPIVHRDIKPQNVLMMTRGNRDVAKIADFGIGKLFESNQSQMYETMTTLAGTAAYMAPEFFMADGGYLKYKAGVDVFSLGLLYHVLLSYNGTNKDLRPISVEALQSNLMIHYGLEMSNAVRTNQPLPKLFKHPQSEELHTHQIQKVILEMTKLKEEDRMNPVNVKSRITDIYIDCLWEELSKKNEEHDQTKKPINEKENVEPADVQQDELGAKDSIIAELKQTLDQSSSETLLLQGRIKELEETLSMNEITFHHQDMTILQPDETDYKVSSAKGIYRLVEYKNICLPITSLFWSTEVLDCVIQHREIVREMTTRDMAKRYEEINTMVLSAKLGKWGDVFSILDKNENYINAIPPERTWSILHQAVYMNKMAIVERLLSYPVCDMNIRSKQNPHHKSGLRPIDLAEKYWRQNIIQILKSPPGTNMDTGKPIYKSLFPRDRQFILEGVPYFWLGLASMKKYIVEDIVHKNSHCFFDLTLHIYNYMRYNWKAARKTVGDCLFPFDAGLHIILQQAKAKVDFFQAIISLYNRDSVSEVINMALTESCSHFKPSRTSILLSLYALLLESLLLHWDGIQRLNFGTVYCAAELSKPEKNPYTINKKFTWSQFTTAVVSKPATISENTLFIIKNCQVHESCTPCAVEDYDESSIGKLLYPASAEFNVTDIKELPNHREIYVDAVCDHWH